MQTKEQNIELWYDTALRRKPDKAIVKLHHEDGTFIKAINVPTVNWPLNGPYQVFSFRNTKPCTDDGVHKVFDQQTYNIGQCYSNTAKLVADLRAQGYDAKSYVGWLFTGADQRPVHHCWAVLNGVHVLDLCDDTCVMLYARGKELRQANEREKTRKIMADFIAETKSWPNSHRCAPVGVPYPDWLYIGSECLPEEGAKIYQAFARKHPEYERHTNTDSTGRTEFQRLLDARGLL